MPDLNDRCLLPSDQHFDHFKQAYDRCLLLEMAERVEERDKRISDLWRENLRLKKFAVALAERVAGQSELLSRRAANGAAAPFAFEQMG